MSFAEVRLEGDFWIYGTVGGPEYSTNIVTVNSGFEFRNKNWTVSRGRWDYGQRKCSGAELRSIVGFFRARNGRFQGFRFRDLGDYKATKDDLTEFGVTTRGVFVNVSTTAAQMTKKYTSGSDIEFRTIAKPVASTIKVYKDGALQTLTTDYTLDDTTGIVTFVSPFGSASLTWDGEFDTPVRFDADNFRYVPIAGTPDFNGGLSEVYFELQSIPLVEIRV